MWISCSNSNVDTCMATVQPLAQRRSLVSHGPHAHIQPWTPVLSGLVFNLLRRNLVGERNVQSTLVQECLREDLGRRSIGESCEGTVLSNRPFDSEDVIVMDGPCTVACKLMDAGGTT